MYEIQSTDYFGGWITLFKSNDGTKAVEQLKRFKSLARDPKLRRNVPPRGRYLRLLEGKHVIDQEHFRCAVPGGMAIS